MDKPAERTAVVVVHGMGNQYPMQTLRSFVEALQSQDSTLYSSPNRITDDREVRRLSISRRPFDYFEYYWAHQVEEPGFAEVLSWCFKLLFVKTPSASLSRHIGIVRFVVIALPLLLAGIGVLGYWLLSDYINSILKVSFYGLSLLVVLRFAWSLLSASVIGNVQASVGDVIRYTIPSPKNIAVRERIRKNGIELLRKLHEAKNTDGVSPKYGRIILVGHSLGSIVAYDILSSLFAEYHGNYKDVPDVAAQDALATLRSMYDAPDHNNGKYQNAQAALFKEYRSIGNQWRVKHFITMGSPLTHASMILNDIPENFDKKKNQREFPISPPQLDHLDDHFAYDGTFKSVNQKDVTLKMLHHAAHFAATKWTNVYFTNDWIGGPMASEFGEGIIDIEVTAVNKNLRRIPLSTHTKYWDIKETVSLEKLKELLQKS